MASSLLTRAASLGFCFAALLLARPALAQTYYVFTTLAGSPGQHGYADAKGGAARFNFPFGVAVDASGNVFVTDGPEAYDDEVGPGMIRKITPDGAVTSIAGSPNSYGNADGAGSAARFSNPVGIAVDTGGNLFVADFWNSTIRKISAAGVVTTPAGPRSFSFPYYVAVDTTGNVFVPGGSNTSISSIRKMTATGVVTNFEGEGNSSGQRDVTNSLPPSTSLRGIAVDTSGNLFVAAFHNHTIQKITRAGVVTTLAGLGFIQGSADGTGSAARFYFPDGVAVDGSGNLFVVDSGNHTIRKIAPDGVVTTVAGLAGSYGSADGAGSAVRFNNPNGVAVDASGNIYVADAGNGTIRKGVPMPGFAPAISTQPQNQTIARGHIAVFNATASGSPAPTYQWTRNGVALAGATDATFVLTKASDANTGSYQCIVTNAAGSATSSAVALSIVDALDSGRFKNFSTRASVSSGRSIIAGFWVDGPQQKTVLVCGLGPALAAFGVNGALADPKLEIFNSAGQRIAENDNWSAGLASVFTSAGAYALPAGSKDAAILLPLQPGAYTAVLSGADGGNGEGLIEIYETP
jgi:sugar lactone lactonase YvrE